MPDSAARVTFEYKMTRLLHSFLAWTTNILTKMFFQNTCLNTSKLWIKEKKERKERLLNKHVFQFHLILIYKLHYQTKWWHTKCSSWLNVFPLTCPIVLTLFKMEKSVACVVGARQECKQHTTREQTQDLYTQPLAGVSA